NEIIDQYLYDENPTRPWIIGFSGGKDSTMLLQVVWNALKKIDRLLKKNKSYESARAFTEIPQSI
ncbi:MAG: hypothetical protein IT243_09915, partial [Bacteroidia bacterium]|nr:hypothetical protein [Bacteroidia bacterium]